MIPPTLVTVNISAANDPVDGGEIDIRCNLVQQDTSRRKRCPNGQGALIDALRARAGLSIPDRSDEDADVFTMPILTQDRSGFDSSLSLSHGDLSEPEITTQNDTVSIQLSLSDFSSSGDEATPYKVDLAAKVKAKVGLEIDFIRSAKATGRLFDSAGDVVYQSGTPLITSGDDLLTRKPVVGNISVAYTVSGQLQTATIPPREDAAAGNYEASLWIASTCGKVSHFEIEVPECFQRAWWQNNGLPGQGGGDFELIEQPNYAEKTDAHYNWLTCGLHEAADQQTTDAFSEVPGDGPVYYPGVRLTKKERESAPCYSGKWNGDD